MHRAVPAGQDRGETDRHVDALMQKSLHEEGVRVLTPAQRRSLQRVTMSPQTPPLIARRAHMVLDADADPSRHAVSPTPRKWLQRYLESGLSGLEDAERSGRPSTITEDALSRVLTEPLFIPSAKWTSRTIAEAVGISQSTVVRLWAHVFDPDALQSAGPWARWERTCRPTGLFLSSRTAVLVLAHGRSRHSALRTDPRRDGGAAFSMRSSLRAPLQTILAAEILTADTSDTPLTSDFLTAAMPDTDGDFVVVCRSSLDDEVASWVETQDGIEVVVVPPDRWQALLPHVGAAIAPTALPALEELAHRVREWAQQPTSALCWPAPDVAKPPVTRIQGPPPVPLDLSPSQRLAESVAAAIQEGIHAGRLLGGERVTESFLMRATHASRSQVRDALRSLASDGLIDLQAGRGAVVPTPAVEDVLETYAVRRALGNLIVSSAVGWRPGALEPLAKAMNDLRDIARKGDTWATGEADLDFQDALAATANLRRVPVMFRRMTTQLRLFISVMGLDYAYSIDDIVTDDAALLDAVIRRDSAAAQDLWEQKMDAAVSYMVRRKKNNTWRRRG